MRLVVLDTNVIVAAGIRLGSPPAEIVAAWYEAVAEKCEGLVKRKRLARIELAQRRLPLIEAVGKIPHDLPVAELDRRLQAVTCPWVVGEYREVVRRAKFQRYGFPPRWLDFLIEESLFLADPAPWLQPGPDPKDDPFRALARAAGAWLVTGNLKHFPEATREGVTVLSPAGYLAHLLESRDRSSG